MLKKLYEEFDLSIERMLLKEYKRLQLTSKELNLLIAFFDINRKRKTFSMTSLAKRVEFSTKELGSLVDKLIDKGFVTLSLEKNNGKEREVFNLDNTFTKIEQLYLTDEINIKREENQNRIKETLNLFETALGRTLTGVEFEFIRKIYDEEKYSHDKVMESLNLSIVHNRVNVKYIEKLLDQKVVLNKELDPDVESALDKLYKAIK